MEFKFSKQNIVLLAALILIMILGLFIVDSSKKKSHTQEKTKTEKIVSDYSKFFSISNAADKYISYLEKQDRNNLMLLLNKQYIEENNINKDNILNKLELLDKEYNFDARKMYQLQVNNNITKYYIYGHLTENMITGYKKPKDYYLIINLDVENMLYDVTPYDGKIFKEES